MLVASVFILDIWCFGQERVDSITAVLNTAHLSGSIVYSSSVPCNPLTPPPLPKIRPTNYSGSPREVLQEMFADDAKMRVIQEPGGMIRMVETGVPTDILDLKIRHVSFPTDHDAFRVPIFALWIIMRTPEVESFAKEHNIGPLYSGRVPGNPYTYRPQVSGELKDVTVSQALDYVLLTYPGYWIYRNCTNEVGGREVLFSFIENAP